MIGLKIAFAIIFASGAAYICSHLFKGIRQALQTGRAPACRNVFERRTDPARYWMSLIGQSLPSGLFFIMACLLLIASLRGIP
jgi:hypothetical protein